MAVQNRKSFSDFLSRFQDCSAIFNTANIHISTESERRVQLVNIDIFICLVAGTLAFQGSEHDLHDINFSMFDLALVKTGRLSLLNEAST